MQGFLRGLEVEQWSVQIGFMQESLHKFTQCIHLKMTNIVLLEESSAKKTYSIYSGPYLTVWAAFRAEAP